MASGRKGKTNLVFGEKRSRHNTVLNIFGHPEKEFMYYGEQYHEAAKDLLKVSLATKSSNGIRSCPIAFLYRHALELQLKAVLIHGNGIFRLHDMEECNPKALDQHDLCNLLAAVEPIFDHMGWDEESFAHESITGYEHFKTVIRDFNKIDAGSYTFRYPVQKARDENGDRKPSVGKHFAFDVFHVSALLDPVLDMLSGAAYSLDAYYDSACEAMAEARQDAMPSYEPPEYDHEPGYYGE